MANKRNWLVYGPLLVLVVLVIGLAWLRLQPPALPEGIASGNGRVEATEYDIASNQAGRVNAVLVSEGEMVIAGQVLATLDTENLSAQLREAEARLREARQGRHYAEAVVTQRESELKYAEAELTRSMKLVKQGHVSQDRIDQVRTRKLSADAALRAARVQTVQAEASIDAASARVERLQSEIADATLSAPVASRVLYRLAEPGEVIPMGGKVLTVLDLSDVYMTVFLPTAQAGRVSIGTEARIILDAVPEMVLPATVSFVAARAQFTPREVETRTEREKLMFRVKVHIAPDILNRYTDQVKTGVPGVAYIQLDGQTPWPEFLEVRLPSSPASPTAANSNTP